MPREKIKERFAADKQRQQQEILALILARQTNATLEVKRLREGRALGEAGDVPPMRVVNATRRREHCVLADDDAAWVRERYAADAELWDRVNVGDGGFRAVF